jgi:hypothetical protein
LACGMGLEVSQAREPVESGFNVIFACSEEQVRRAVVVDVFAVNGIFYDNWALTFTQNSRRRREEKSADFGEVEQSRREQSYQQCDQA